MQYNREENKHFIDYYTDISAENKKIIKKYTNTAPVEVEEICNQIGLYIKREDLDWDISGKITKIQNTERYCISVNSLHVLTRQRFTIAHELGHYLLHRSHIGDGIIEDSLYRSESISSWKDVEANKFVVKLLMPIELVLAVGEDNPNLSDMASALKVSLAALHIRLGVPME